MSTAVMEGDQLAQLNQKLDALSQQVQILGEQVQFLTERANADRLRQQEWDDFKADVSPIVQDMYNVTVEQMQEIQDDVQLEDLLLLLRRLARNTRTFNEMLSQLESLNDFLQDASPLTKELFEEMVVTLSQLQDRGYFGFLRQSGYIVDQIVTSFSEEDVRLLGDNVVLILNTVKALTQPEIMNLANNLTAAYQEAEGKAGELPTSVWGLMGQMRDPEVRRGLAITMATLRAISKQQPYAGPRVTGNGNRAKEG